MTSHRTPSRKTGTDAAADTGPPASGACREIAAGPELQFASEPLIARFPSLTSWSDCPVPLTGVYSRDVYADGHEDGWLLVTTNENWSAPARARPVRPAHRH